MLDPVTERFVDAAAALPPEVLALAFDRQLDHWAGGGKAASDAAGPSASENSALDRRIRTTLRPCADELDAHLAGLHSDALTVISTAARAIQTRRRLTAGQYDVLVGPFAGFAVELPEHSAGGPGA